MGNAQEYPSEENSRMFVNAIMPTWGYRPASSGDLKIGSEIILINAPRFLWARPRYNSKWTEGRLLIVIDDCPTRVNGYRVSYHFATPAFEGQRFVPVADFLRDAWVPETDPQVLDRLNRALL